jgi:hypothetical protein
MLGMVRMNFCQAFRLEKHGLLDLLPKAALLLGLYEYVFRTHDATVNS